MKIKIIQVLRGKANKDCLVYFQIGNDFYSEKFDYSEVESFQNFGLISPHSKGFNLFFANNPNFKNELFKIMQNLIQGKFVNFPVLVELEWKDFVLKKKELQTA
jgi:hypothetical protein